MNAITLGCLVENLEDSIARLEAAIELARGLRLTDNETRMGHLLRQLKEERAAVVPLRNKAFAKMNA